MRSYSINLIEQEKPFLALLFRPYARFSQPQETLFGRLQFNRVAHVVERRSNKGGEQNLPC